ncbi:MAG: peptidyl-alpha-hydroxyglycine alpha-amidating lyase family protein [Planctomycetia bacterium]|jgi:DNA-binding beta-propeller fold protein YncE
MYRRPYFTKFVWALLLALIIMPASIITAANQEGTKVTPYKHVEWPTLPAGFEMAPANGIDIDSKGRIYAAAGEKGPILVFSPEGKLLDSWGEGIIKNKHSVRIFDDKVYVCDTELHQVHEFTTDGKLLRSFGTKGTPGTDESHFNKPTDIAVADNGDFYISDGYGNNRIVCLDPQGKFKFAWGEKGTGAGQFDVPHDIVIDKNQKIYVADRSNNRVQVFDRKGQFLKQFKDVGTPYGLEIIPGETEKLLVTDANDNGPHRVLILDLDGNVLTAFGTKGDKPGQLDIPHSIAIDRDGNLYVAEVTNKRISKFVKQDK